MIRSLFALCLAAMSPLTLAGNGLLFVGSGPLCTHSNLQAAINAAANGTVIRIANDQTYNFTNLVISDKSLTLEGGWAQCFGTLSTSWTTLSGAPAAQLPVIEVTSPASSRTVILRGLVLRNGQDGGLAISGPVDVTLEYAAVVGNQAPLGGGIRINGQGTASTVLRTGPLTVGASHPLHADSNVATGSGGGIHCQNARLQIKAETQVSGNRAEINGGGIRMSGCEMSAPARLVIADNLALTAGGGLSAASASEIDLAVAPGSGQSRIERNQALNGAGLHLHGPGTTLEASGLVIADNQATLEVAARGGAATVTNGAQLTLHRLPGTCPVGQVCNRITGNAASSMGGAFHVNDAMLFLSQARVDDNSGVTSLIRIEGDSFAVLGNTLIDSNDSGSANLIQLWNGAILIMNSSTVAGNTSGATLIQAFNDAQQNVFAAVNSILWQPGTTILEMSAQDTGNFDCLNVHENVSIDGLTHDPGFADPGNANYLLAPASSNIDACADPFSPSPPERDLLGWVRPFDAGMGNGAGPFDRGAHEWVDDDLFADRFQDQ